MAGKNKMPPELLEHFKSKAEDKEEKSTPESAKEKRKEAVKKARVRLESKNKKGSDGKEN